MIITPVFQVIDKNRQVYIERLFEYLRMPSISAYGEGMAEVAGHLVDWLSRMGMETSLINTPGWPVVLGKWTKAPGKTTILFYGHYDVQPPDPLEEWLSPPFEPAIRNGRIYARGVGDNKGQHAANLFGIEAVMAAFGELPCNVITMLEGEEETGSPHMPAFIAQHKDDLKADLVIVSDGPVHVSGRATLEFGVRGVISFELRARGANQDLHSGNWGGVRAKP